MFKLFRTFISLALVLLMVGLIPLVKNDYILTGVFVFIILVDAIVRKNRSERMAILFGFFAMTMFEYLFVATGVETFSRQSFLGVMPLWLPFLWAYGFLAIKRGAETIDRK